MQSLHKEDRYVEEYYVNVQHHLRKYKGNQMSQQLYMLDEDNQAIPVSWGKYEEWESCLNRSEKSVLGKKLRSDTVGNTNVTTFFMSTPIGFYGRKPQLWVTIASGPDLFIERVYSSHRAAISGHLAQIRDLKKAKKKQALGPSKFAIL
jgi:hypothetical protein